jgi:hypothetical protein
MTLKEVQVPENSENKNILINYISTKKKRRNQNEIVVDNMFSYNISLNMIGLIYHLI